MRYSRRRLRSSSLYGRGSARQHGATLIEVLIAVLILGVGLLGVAAIQAVALRNSQASVERTQAVIQSYSILDAMRANVTAARAGAYNVGKTCEAPATGTRAQSDLNFWLTSLHETIGDSACGAVSCGTNDVCSVTVYWNESRATAGSKDMKITTTSRL